MLSKCRNDAVYLYWKYTTRVHVFFLVKKTLFQYKKL